MYYARTTYSSQNLFYLYWDLKWKIDASWDLLIRQAKYKETIE